MNPSSPQSGWLGNSTRPYRRSTMPVAKTVAEYIAQHPANVQKLLKEIRRTMRAELPDAVEVISYGIPTFKAGGKSVIYFAGFKDHVSVYPVPEGSATFQKQVDKFQTGRGTLQFPLDKPLPLAFIRQVTRLRQKDVESKLKKRSI
jgi:uncharacterized protein YdhG (YjbR/CyaY superfamily)